VVPFFGCIAGAAIYDAFMFEGEGSSVKDALDSAERRQGDISLD
jgi:aquaglyceroporin related protein